MFESEHFRNQLEAVVEKPVRNHGLKTTSKEIVSFLQGLAMDNEKDLMKSESLLWESKRRGIPDALVSADTLIKTAIEIARKNGRSELLFTDIEKAYKRKYCTFWPFCRPKMTAIKVLSVQRRRLASGLREKMQQIENQLQHAIGATTMGQKKSILGAATKAKISDAAKARWAKIVAAKAPPASFVKAKMKKQNKVSKAKVSKNKASRGRGGRSGKA